MDYSMTGFGRGQNLLSDRKCTVEIKSVNSKYCDIQIRLPRILNGIENRIRENISTQLHRGKIDVYITYDDFRDDYKEVIADKALVKAYKKALTDISEIIGENERIYASNIAKFSDVLKVTTTQPDDEEIWEFVSVALTMALLKINEMRKTEGDALVSNIKEKSITLMGLYENISQRAPFVAIEFASRLNKRIKDLADDLSVQKIDEQRLSMEVAMFSDKCTIDEELVRLQSHLNQLDQILKEEGSKGKKLDFLIQEINREINTIGSKANDLEITKTVIDMKAQVENIREQIQNME